MSNIGLLVMGFPSVVLIIIGNVDELGSMGSVPISRVGGSESRMGKVKSIEFSLSKVESDGNNSLKIFSNTIGSNSSPEYRKRNTHEY